jgi:hypothetical protein
VYPLHPVTKKIQRNWDDRQNDERSLHLSGFPPQHSITNRDGQHASDYRGLNQEVPTQLDAVITAPDCEVCSSDASLMTTQEKADYGIDEKVQ